MTKSITKRKIVYFSSIIILIIFAFIYFYPNSKAITLQDAYNMSLKEALIWNKNALLYYATSADISNDETKMPIGKRTAWNFDFTEANNEHLIIEIQYGKIIKKTKTKGPVLSKDKLIDSSEFQFDFKNALRDAKNNFLIEPGINWAIGFHCFVSKIDGIPNICVMGQDSEKRQMKVYYNLTTGEFIKAEHKIMTGGGLYINEEKTDLINSTCWGALGITYSKNGKSYLVWGYKDVNKEKPSAFIKECNNDTFSDINIDFNVFECWYSTNYGNNTIFALSENNIFYSENKGKNWTKLFDIPIIIQDYYIGKTTFAIKTDSQLYIITDGTNEIQTIELPADKTSAIKVILFSNGIYLLKNNQLYVYNNCNWELINTQFDTQICFVFNLENNLILASKEAIYVLDSSLKIVNVLNPNSGAGIDGLYIGRENSIITSWGNNICDFKLEGGEYICSNIKKYNYGKVEEVTYSNVNQLVVCAMPFSTWETVN